MVKLVNLIRSSFSATLFTIIMVVLPSISAAAGAVLVVLPIQEPISVGWDTGMIEDLFLVRLAASNQFSIREDRGITAIEEEQRMIREGLATGSISLHTYPDADIVVSLLVGKWENEARLYARTWMAKDGSALLAIMTPISVSTYFEAVTGLADELLFSLSTMTGDTSAVSSRILLSKGRFSEAESIMHVRWIYESASPELAEDLNKLRIERIKLMRNEMDDSLKLSDPDLALLIFNDLYRLDPTADYLKNYSDRVVKLVDQNKAQTASEIYKEASLAYRQLNIEQGNRLKDSLVSSYVDTDIEKNLEALGFSYADALSKKNRKESEFLIKGLSLTSDPLVAVQQSDRAVETAAISVLNKPESPSTWRQLKKSGNEYADSLDEYQRQMSGQALWQIERQNPRITYSLSYTSAPYLPHQSLIGEETSSVHGIEFGANLNYPYQSAWSFRLSPFAGYEGGVDSGESGIYSWEGRNDNLWFTLEAGPQIGYRFFHFGFGPVIQIGFGSVDTNWSSGESMDDFLFSYGIGGYINAVGYLFQGLGIEFKLRLSGTKTSGYPWDFRPVVAIGTVIDIEGF